MDRRPTGGDQRVTEAAVVEPVKPMNTGTDPLVLDRTDAQNFAQCTRPSDGSDRLSSDCLALLSSRCDNHHMPTAAAKKPRKKTTMSDAHKAALAAGREEGRIVRKYLEAIEQTKPRRGRKRSPDAIVKRLAVIEDELLDADPLSRLHLIEERQRLQAALEQADDAVDHSELEEEFVRVAKAYGERKGISYSAWRAVGVSASVLQRADIARSRR